MKVRQPEATGVLDQAMEWMERLRISDKESAAFFDWLTDSPRHVEVFMQAMTLEHRLAAIPAERWATLEAAANADEGAEGELTNVVSLSTRAVVLEDSIPKRRWWLTAVAAGAVLVVSGWYVSQRLGGWQEFTTAVGEQRAVQLPDGSIVNINTDSRVKVHLSAQARDIRLLQGEALFKVQHDVARPFRVHAGDVVIQAVGTQFDVYRRTHNTTVSVLEGRVRVGLDRIGSAARDATEPKTTSGEHPAVPTAISAGEQADIGHDGRIKRRTPLNAVHVTAWQQRRLMFDEETLATISAEFNRYNHRHFRLEGTDAGGRRFSGIFDADDPESLAQLLSRDNGLTVERNANEIVIRSRAAVEPPAPAGEVVR